MRKQNEIDFTESHFQIYYSPSFIIFQNLFCLTECGAPPLPADSSIEETATQVYPGLNVYIYGDRVEYSCTGMQIVGETLNQCLDNGQWSLPTSGDLPVCMPCKLISNLDLYKTLAKLDRNLRKEKGLKLLKTKH